MMGKLKTVRHPCPLSVFKTSVLIFIVSTKISDATIPERGDSFTVLELSKEFSFFQQPQTTDLFPPQRGKRKAEDDDYKKHCTRLPPKPGKSKSLKDQIKLPDLLNISSQNMLNNNNGTQVKEAVLVLGTTGTGKTTLTQMVTGNLSSLQAVLTQSGGLVIIDDGNRIGAPTTISQTLIPELVFTQNGTAFFDCPDFDDNTPEKDIAANLLINQVIQKLDRVKFLFLIIHNSVKPGQDRLDFDLLATHATQFLKNIPNYRSSIGLVVTKVNNFNEWGKFLTDNCVVKEIVQFLSIYLENLRSQVNSVLGGGGGGSMADLERKIQFVETVLEKNEQEQYGRMSFSRSPTACGALSDSQVVYDSRKRLIKLYSEGLEYSPVNQTDFGYTFRDKTKLAILEYVSSLNGDVKKNIESALNEYKNWFDGQFMNGDDLIIKMQRLKSASAALERSVADWNNLRNQSNPEDILTVLRYRLQLVDYSIPQNHSLFMKTQQSYFNFFDEVNTVKVNRAVKEWLVPVEEMAKIFKEAHDKAKQELMLEAKTLFFRDRVRTPNTC